MAYLTPPILGNRFRNSLVLLVAITVGLPIAAGNNASLCYGAEAVQQVAAPKDLAALQAIQEQVKAVARKALPSTVAVRIGAAQGSGIIVSEDGHVLTAGHVAGNPGQKVVFVFGDGKTVEGTVLGINRRDDAGLAKITDQGPWPFVEMRDSEELELGTWCVAVGHPLGYQEGRPPVVRVGRLLESRETVIQTDCPLVAGDSGGPLFDLEGHLIGVNSRIAGSTSMNFHVPVDLYRQCWDRLLKGEAWDNGIPGKDSTEVKAAFREVVAEAGACVVRVRCDGKDAALGTIVGPDGWVLTKASELAGRIVCRHRDGRELEAQVVGVHPQYDLAMLKIQATGLPIIQWGQEGEPPVGGWVATPGVEDGPPLALGVIGVPRRKVPPASGVLGVGVQDADGGARIMRVLPDSPAEKAGLQVDDVITHVDGSPAQNQREMIAAVKQHPPGHVVRLTVKRGDRELEMSAELAKLDTPGARKRDMQNHSHVGISKRHNDFPAVLQHDTVLRPLDCGGPLVDLSGKVIGVNIARGGRTETYSVPSHVLLTLMYDLMSGRLSPPPPESRSEQKPGPEQEPEAQPAPEAEQRPEAQPAPEAEQKPEAVPTPESEGGSPSDKKGEAEKNAESENKPEGEEES